MCGTEKKRRRIVYGIHGYGRGHAVRAQAILPLLTAKYDVLIFAGDDAYDQLHRDWPVIRVPTLRYHTNQTGARSATLTVCRNIPILYDVIIRGRIFRIVRDAIAKFEPHVALCDTEVWTHRVARYLKVPRISFDRFAAMALCRYDLPVLMNIEAMAESLVYRALICRPERIIASAFCHGRPMFRNMRLVGSVLRPQVLDARAEKGEFLLAYFSNASANYTASVEAALKLSAGPVKMYHPTRRGLDANIEYLPIETESFIRDFARCRGVFSTAGNQLISEAIHLGKPMLILPEDSLEQRLNARMVELRKIGMTGSREAINADMIRKFLSSADELAVNIPQYRRNGLNEAMTAIEEAIDSLAE